MPDHGANSTLLQFARALRPRIITERDRIETARRIPEDIAQDLAGAGFFRIFLPEAYGGLDLAPMQAMEIFEELARADASVAWCVWNSNTHWTIAQLSPAAAQTIHADPDVVTANSTRSSGQAQVVAGGYRVSGRWSMVSGCELAAWMVLLCIVRENGKPRLTPGGALETRFMILPSTACEIIDTWTVGGCAAPAAMMWWYATYSCRPIMGRGSPIRTSCLVTAIAFRRFPASSPALVRWRWGSREPRSRPSARLPAQRRRSGRPKCCGITMGRKSEHPRRSRWCARRGCFCLIAWISYGAG
jgi:hypothetical protein